jgi:hypothetical protein
MVGLYQLETIRIWHLYVRVQYVFTVPKNFGNGKVDSEVAL